MSVPKEVTINNKNHKLLIFKQKYDTKTGTYGLGNVYKYENLEYDDNIGPRPARVHQAYAAHLFLQSIKEAMLKDKNLNFIKQITKYIITLDGETYKFKLQLLSLKLDKESEANFLLIREDSERAAYITVIGGDDFVPPSPPEHRTIQVIISEYEKFAKQYNNSDVWLNGKKWKFTFQNLVDLHGPGMGISLPVPARAYQAYAVKLFLDAFMEKSASDFEGAKFTYIYKDNLQFSLTFHGGKVEKFNAKNDMELNGEYFIYEFFLTRQNWDSNHSFIKAVLVAEMSGGESKTETGGGSKSNSSLFKF